METLTVREMDHRQKGREIKEKELGKGTLHYHETGL
jgi:hypothetical protein